MCGRYAQTLPPELIAELFRVVGELDLEPRYNVTPGLPVLGVREAAGMRRPFHPRWGLVPSWVEDPRKFPLLVNARAETMAAKPAFRDALRRRRCILPATGYYEWQTGEGGEKRPYFITFADQRPMALAGLWASWTAPDGSRVESVATITVPANDQLSVIHDRMPVILEGAALDAWLDDDTAGAAQLALPLENGALVFHPVSRRVNAARSEGPDLIAPIAPEAPAQRPAEQLGLF